VSLGTLEPRQRPDDAKLSAVPVERCGGDVRVYGDDPNVGDIEKNQFKPDSRDLVSGNPVFCPQLPFPAAGGVFEWREPTTSATCRPVAHVVASGCRASDLNRLRHFSPSAICIPLTLERTGPGEYWAHYWKNGPEWLFRLSVAGLCRVATHGGLTTSRDQGPGLQFAMDRGAL